MSTANTPLRTETPTGSVPVPAPRDRSGTIIARPIWDQSPAPNRPRRAPVTPTSRPDTETEDDGDVDMDQSLREAGSPLSRRAVGIVTADVPNGALPDDDARIIINDSQVEGGDRGVEDGIVSMEANNDFAMGAPPGAPGAIDESPPTPAALPSPPPNRRRGLDAPDATPRAGVIPLPNVVPTVHTMSRTATIRARNTDTILPTATNAATAAAAANTSGRHHHHHHRDAESGPYRDEDVLLSLQLLAYLSKYPHVRQAFYKTRPSFHPASVNLTGGKYGIGANPNASHPMSTPSPPPVPVSGKDKAKESLANSSGFLKAFGAKGKERASPAASSSASASSVASTTSSTAIAAPSTSNVRQTNVFSLVERFTFRPSSTETETGNAPPKLPPEIQYWAGVIMRNACRKDESRGGIRQCANSKFPSPTYSLLFGFTNRGYSALWALGGVSSRICKV